MFYKLQMWDSSESEWTPALARDIHRWQLCCWCYCLSSSGTALCSPAYSDAILYIRRHRHAGKLSSCQLVPPPLLISSWPPSRVCTPRLFLFLWPHLPPVQLLFPVPSLFLRLSVCLFSNLFLAPLIRRRYFNLILCSCPFILIILSSFNADVISCVLGILLFPPCRCLVR